MKRRASSSESGSHTNNKGGSHESVNNIRTKPPHIYDNITRRLLQFGVTLAITTFIGLIVRYAVQEFDPSVSTITVTTSRVNNRDIASLSVSKHFLERLLEFIEESIAVVAAVLPLGFPLCTLFNRYFAKIRANSDKIEISGERVLNMIPKYLVIGDSQACQLPNSTRLRPLIRDTIYQLIKARLKPKLLVEESQEEARKMAIRIGLVKRDHHKLAVLKSVDLLKNITDSRGDIRPDKVRFVLARLKVLSQATPADKSLLVYLMKHCEMAPNENVAYLGYTFTDPEAMKLADCALSFQDCYDDDVKMSAQVKLKSENMTFTDVYLFLIVCLLVSNITQSYALYQISASISCCLYRFLSITVFQEQLLTHSQFTLIIVLHQLFAIAALMTKWLASLPLAPLRWSVAEMAHAATEDSLAASGSNLALELAGHRSTSKRSITASVTNGNETTSSSQHRDQPHPAASSIRMQRLHGEGNTNEDDTLGSSSSLNSSGGEDTLAGQGEQLPRVQRRLRRRHRAAQQSQQSDQHIHLSGIDLDQAVINSKLVTSYRQTFRNSNLIDDVTYRLAKLHIAYQALVMIIIMIFGNAMFQLSSGNNRQHQTLALNSLLMNNVFNLANCFNQFGAFELAAGFRRHPIFVCVLLSAIFLQVSLTELNAFGLANLNPLQWFVCFVFGLLSALIAPLTGQQQRQRAAKDTRAAMLLQPPLQPHRNNHAQRHNNSLPIAKPTGTSASRARRAGKQQQ